MAQSVSKGISIKKDWFIFLILLIEGGALMASELIGAKLIAPYYGNSLYVWAAVLAITLGGLSIGYYTGGNISSKYPNIKTLILIVSVSSLLVFAMPVTSSLIMSATLGFELRVGIILSCIVFLMPPLICFGMVGPMAVRLVTPDTESVGKAAGTVYFTSTLGGIATTFLFGFYLIPFWGLKMSSYTTGLALAVIPLLYFIISKTVKSK